MMVASMIMPIEIANPPRDIRLALNPTIFMTMNVDSRERGRAINTTKEALKLLQQEIKNDQHQKGAFDQRLSDRGHAGLDDVGPVVIGQYPDPFGKNVVLVDLFDLLL